MATSAELIAEGSELFNEAEKATRRLAKRLPAIVRGVVQNGDTASLGALKEMQLQLEAKARTSQVALDLVEYHQELVETLSVLGIDVPPPPVGDDEIVVFSSGR